MQMLLHEVDLPLRHRFTIAHGSTDVQQNLIVELREADHATGETLVGLGEGASVSYFGISAGDMRRALEDARRDIESAVWTDPEEFWQRMCPLLRHNRFALCALDEAAWDLWGRRHGQPLHVLWHLELAGVPYSNYTIGIDTVERMVEKLQEFEGWPIYKIKLGTPDDLQIVRELRRHTTAKFRVDANTGWTVEQTLSNAKVLKELNVEFIEQPLPADDWDGMRRVFAHCALPVIADESCQVEEDVDRCHGFFHGINIKLGKAGGLTPARRMIERARALGIRVMVGCMTESSVGISAIAQLLPLLDYVDMDGAALLARDVATGVRVEKGRAIFPADNGTGARLQRGLSQDR